jgi:peroxiredoxin
MKKLAGGLLITFVLLCVAGMAVAAVGLRGSKVGDLLQSTVSGGDSSEVWARVGDPSPDFELTTLDGSKARLSDFKGQPVVVNFWATWCGPCQSEMPAIQAAHDRYAKDNVNFLGVNVQESRDAAQFFMTSKSLAFPILLDIAGDVSRTYRVKSLPSTFFVDRQGVLREQFTGEMNASVIDRRVGSLLQGD